MNSILPKDDLNNTSKKGCVIIPTYNESKKIASLIYQIKNYHLDVLVVDDGSTDHTCQLALEAQAEVIAHPKNLGKGAALRSGFNHIKNKNYDFIITLDGDGQHSPQDIPKFIEHYLLHKTDIIVGNRMLQNHNMPLVRKLTNNAMSFLISSICKTPIPDTQCGFRLIKKSLLNNLKISTSNYEIESELLIHAARKKLKIESIPIQTIYEGEKSQINPITDTMRFIRFVFKDHLKETWIISKTIFQDAFIKYGSTIFLSSIIVNLANLIFWLFMVRKLDAINYGTLNSMVSFLGILFIPTAILQTVLTKYVSQFNALKEKDKLKALIIAFAKRTTLIILALIIIICLFSKPIGAFLNLSNHSFIYLAALCVFFSSLLTLSISSMQGLQLFKQLAINSVFQSLTKISTGILLVLSGTEAMGAFSAFFFAAFFAFILSLKQLPGWIFERKSINYRMVKKLLHLKDIYSYFIPVSLATSAYNIFINSDVILVKHFFSAFDTGLYSIAQTIGKIILFLPGAISTVLFPMAVSYNTEKRNPLPLLKKSLLVVGILCAIASTITALYPMFILKLITGKNIKECIYLIRLLVIPMSLFSLSQVLIYYHLSLGNFKYITTVFFISILQIILICLFHQSLLEIIFILILISASIFYLGIKMLPKRKD